jgi:predicted MPP superfamily phosphohydrolase
VAQADPLASARLQLTKQSSVADAPARKILFIAAIPNSTEARPVILLTHLPRKIRQRQKN